MGRYPAALESQRRALQLADELVAEHPEEVSLKIKQARSHAIIAVLSTRLGKPEEAEGHQKISDAAVAALLRASPALPGGGVAGPWWGRRPRPPPTRAWVRVCWP